MKKLARRISVLFLVIVMTVLSVPAVMITAGAVWDGTAATGFASGTGTEADPYHYQKHFTMMA